MYTRIALALGLLGLAAPAAAQSGLGRVDEYMQEVAGASALQGFELDGQALNTHFVAGRLETERSVTLVVHLWAGRSYRFLGACENACTDLNLSLREAAEGGPLLAEDTLADNMPIVEHTPQATGVYLLSVGMVRCTEPECYFGITVLSK